VNVKAPLTNQTTSTIMSGLSQTPDGSLVVEKTADAEVLIKLGRGPSLTCNVREHTTKITTILTRVIRDPPGTERGNREVGDSYPYEHRRGSQII
jgi:hypothetical protein